MVADRGAYPVQNRTSCPALHRWDGTGVTGGAVPSGELVFWPKVCGASRSDLSSRGFDSKSQTTGPSQFLDLKFGTLFRLELESHHEFNAFQEKTKIHLF